MVGCLPALSFSGLREAVLQLGASTLQRRICFIKVVVVRAKCIWLGFRTVQSFKRFSLFIFLINCSQETEGGGGGTRHRRSQSTANVQGFKEQKAECFDGMQFRGEFFRKFCVLVGKILTKGFVFLFNN